MSIEIPKIEVYEPQNEHEREVRDLINQRRTNFDFEKEGAMEVFNQAGFAIADALNKTPEELKSYAVYHYIIGSSPNKDRIAGFDLPNDEIKNTYLELTEEFESK